MRRIGGLKNPQPMFSLSEMPTLNKKKDFYMFTVAETYTNHNSTEVHRICFLLKRVIFSKLGLPYSS